MSSIKEVNSGEFLNVSKCAKRRGENLVLNSPKKFKESDCDDDETNESHVKSVDQNFSAISLQLDSFSPRNKDDLISETLSATSPLEEERLAEINNSEVMPASSGEDISGTPFDEIECNEIFTQVSFVGGSEISRAQSKDCQPNEILTQTSSGSSDEDNAAAQSNDHQSNESSQSSSFGNENEDISGAQSDDSDGNDEQLDSSSESSSSDFENAETNEISKENYQVFQGQLKKSVIVYNGYKYFHNTQTQGVSYYRCQFGIKRATNPTPCKGKLFSKLRLSPNFYYC